MRVSAKPGLWTLDWTHGLDCGLLFGLDFGLTQSSVTTISYYVLVQQMSTGFRLVL